MHDPLSQVVELLRPRAVFANIISGKGHWSVRYSKFGEPSFCIMLEGTCVLAVQGHEPVSISAGDFVLLPATPEFSISSQVGAPPVYIDPNQVAGGVNELRYGDPDGLPDMRSLGGSFKFESADAELLVSLLPDIVHVKDSQRLALLVEIVGEEAAESSPGSEVMLSRLVDLMLVEAMRSTITSLAPPGLLRGLGDSRLSIVLRKIHADIAYGWTIAELASIASLSRSAFFSRFSREVGVSPMEYILLWRMQVAKEQLCRRDKSVAQIAEYVGYGSSSAFSVAFTRYAGVSPGRYSRKMEPGADGVGNT
ncbi:AraC family transcriptional regulator [Neptunicella marina]|uniref:AraC family transcriptional regulator n=1 Tax=Neptunicella marina TaxID=2125989 RepID=A0A8J6ITF9_9ALTE|nr:AraC family transcriptional regulator [Neptunicella marina]MBC3767125.1 AraC family transcriptional regulator [Neptunicella marina]